MTQAELLIPGRNADALGFGRIRPWDRDDDCYISMGTSEEYTNIMLTYCSSYPRNEKLSDRVESNPMIRCLADFVGLSARVMFIKGTQINRIPDPSPNSCGILNSSAASHVFQERIIGFTSEHQHDIRDPDLQHLQWIQKIWVDLSSLRAWEHDYTRSATNSDGQKLLNTLHDTLTELDSWLCTAMPYTYQHLLSQHLMMALSCEDRITEVLREARQRPIPDDVFRTETNDRDCEAMHQYADCVEDSARFKFFVIPRYPASDAKFVNPLPPTNNETLKNHIGSDIGREWLRGLR